MKKQNKVTTNAVAVVEAKPVEPEVLPPLGEVEEPDYTKPAERISFHLGMGQHHGRMALAHIILAGWELAKQKETLGYGGWRDWCKNNLSISYKTADKYIEFFSVTVGKVRTERQIPFAKRVTNKELSAATVGMEEKSARQAMIDLKIIKRADWGGDRRDKAAQNGHTVGRKPKDAPTPDEAAQKAAVRAELVEDEGHGLIEDLAAWALGAEDGFGTLGDAELAKAIKTLKQMLARAEEIQESRRAGR